MLRTILHHPRKLWLRRALFQVHLWVGVLLSVYVAVIGLSGAVLVFQDEIRAAAMKDVRWDGVHVAAASEVIARVETSFPGWRVGFLSPPNREEPRWRVYLEGPGGKDRNVYADAETGVPLAEQGKLFIDFVLDLHVNLLMGRTGFLVNCLAGIGLLLLALTGAVLWWPGVKLWARGLFVSLRHGWKRVNYDAHSAVGIWTLAIVSWWGITAVYFLMPAQVTAVVNAISPLKGMREPAAVKPAASEAVVPLEAILAAQRALVPGYLDSIGLPEKPGGVVTLYVNRAIAGDFSHREVATFDGHTGRLLTVWHYGENQSLGDWFLWLMYPLHFGTLWGMGVKCLWALLGLSLPVLSVTGVLMYWNRWLGARWRALMA